MAENKKIDFETTDGVRISGVWSGAEGAKLVCLLLHMMPAAKESWSPFQNKLKIAGISSLAVDFRGHGESVKKFQISDLKFQNNKEYIVLNYKKFSDAEHQAKIHDVEAAAEWIMRQGIKQDDLTVIGASIGANLAIQYAAEHPSIKAVIALSPGFDYRGVITMPLVKALRRNQKLLLAASDDDPEAYNAAQKLNEISLAKTTLKLLVGAGHGTTMLDRDPLFMDDLVKWAINF